MAISSSNLFLVLDEYVMGNSRGMRTVIFSALLLAIASEESFGFGCTSAGPPKESKRCFCCRWKRPCLLSGLFNYHVCSAGSWRKGSRLKSGVLENRWVWDLLILRESMLDSSCLQQNAELLIRNIGLLWGDFGTVNDTLVLQKWGHFFPLEGKVPSGIHFCLSCQDSTVQYERL